MDNPWTKKTCKGQPRWESATLPNDFSCLKIDQWASYNHPSPHKHKQSETFHGKTLLWLGSEISSGISIKTHDRIPGCVRPSFKVNNAIFTIYTDIVWAYRLRHLICLAKPKMWSDVSSVYILNTLIPIHGECVIIWMDI